MDAPPAAFPFPVLVKVSVINFDTGNLTDLCVLRWDLSDRLHFRLGRWGAEPPKHYPPSQMSDLHAELLQGVREERAPAVLGTFLKYVLLAAFSVLFHPP